MVFEFIGVRPDLLKPRYESVRLRRLALSFGPNRLNIEQA